MPHSTVTYSRHARERMRERGIAERLVAATLADPDRIRLGSRGNRIAEKRNERGATLRVVFEDRIGPDGRYTHVVTVMWA